MIRWTALSFAVLGISQYAHAETLPGPIPADLVRIVDGDTVRVRAHVWINQSVEISVRIAGIDAPEIARPDCIAERRKADEAKAEVAELIGNDMVALHNVRLGKYAGRVIADIETATGLNIGSELMAQNLAEPEDSRIGWCPSPSD
ncbi:MAG: thermonuclease family protein [Hyphomonadaceae bacterium]